MEIDHIFMFVEPNGPELEQFKALDLIETYRREHPGQGTANACFCFENVFIELLWIVNPAEALTPAIVRTGLEPRSRWRTAGTCPFGIAWRGGAKGLIETWDFAPPYLPHGVTIDVACDGDDPRQPMMFTFPGSQAPRNWVDTKRGQLQTKAGFDVISKVTLTLPESVSPSTALHCLVQSCQPQLEVTTGVEYGLELAFSGPNRCETYRLR
jgi:hypothetical protein